MTNVTDGDSILFTDVATIHSSGSSDSGTSVAPLIPSTLPGVFGNYSYVSTPPIYGAGFLPAGLPGTFRDYGNTGDVSSTTSQNWSLGIRSHDNFALMGILPVYQSLTFSKEFGGEGSGEVVFSTGQSIFHSPTFLGGPPQDLLDFENIWEVYYNGQVVFQFLSTTVDVMEADTSTNIDDQTVTISGPGIANTLTWGSVLSPGFPNVVNKLSSLTDSFGSSALNLTLWNATAVSDVNSGTVSVDVANNALEIFGRDVNNGIPSAGSTAYDATNSFISMKVNPLGSNTIADGSSGQGQTPSNFVTNGSFVEGLSNWSTGANSLVAGGGIASPYTADSVDGDGFSAEVHVFSVTPNQGLSQTINNLLPNTHYRVTCWVKTINGTVMPYLALQDTTNNITSSGNASTSSGSWEQLSATIITGSTANVDLLVAVLSGNPVPGGTYFLIDNVWCFQEIPLTFTSLKLGLSSDPSNNYVAIEYEGAHQLVARVETSGANVALPLGFYNPVENLYWRIREAAGVFYFDFSPDGTTWSNRNSWTHPWNASSVQASMSAWWIAGAPSNLSPALFSIINANSSSADQNSYFEVSNMGIFLDLLGQSQRRGTCTFIQPTFTATKDSNGNPWTDTASMEIANGSDLTTQMQASVAAINAEWMMRPNFYLDVAPLGSLGVDRSNSIFFYYSGQMVSMERTRTRDTISNYIVVADTSGNIVLQTDNDSITKWGQREKYVTLNTPSDKGTLNQIANATVLEYRDEVSQRVMDIPPDLPGRTLFKDFDVGDYISVQNLSLTSADKVRLVVAAVSIDNQENVTIELTLETRIQLLIEQMNNLLQKIASQVSATAVPSPGFTSQLVSPSATTAGRTYAQTLGDGSTTTFHITHALGTQDVQVAVKLASSPFTVQNSGFTVTTDSSSEITVTFSVAPSVNEYRIVVMS